MSNPAPPESGDQPAEPRPQRAIIHVADSEGFTGPLPWWVEHLAELWGRLRDDAERLLPSAHGFDHAPDLECRSSLKEFLGSLGVRFDSAYIERVGCSSHDWDAYVYEDEVDALVAAEEAEIDKAREDLIAEATAALIPSGADYHAKVDILQRLRLAKDPAFVRRLEQDDKEAEEITELRAELEEKEDQLNTKDEIIEELEIEVRRRHTLRREAVANALAGVEKYEALARTLQVRFGIILNGPLLTARDGSTYLLTHIFGADLKDWPAGRELLDWDAVASGKVRKITISNTHLRGWREPISVDAEWIKRYYPRPHDWRRAWWYYFAFYQSHTLRLNAGPELRLGLSAEETEELKAIGKDSWQTPLLSARLDTVEESE